LQKLNLALVESVVCQIFGIHPHYLVDEVESGDDNLQVGTCSTDLSGAKEFVKIKVPHDTERGRITIDDCLDTYLHITT